MKNLLAIIATAAAVATGCRATPLKERFDAVGKDIASARAAGAPDYAPHEYWGAHEALDLARDSEESALATRAEAEEAREEALFELEALKKLTADREAALEAAEKRLAGAEAHLRKLEARELELRRRGVTDKEIERAIGDDVALAQLEASAARASIRTAQAEIELLGVRREEAEARVRAANDAIAVAGQQLIHASTLCDTAGATARTAEAHAIARRKAELKVR